MEINKNHERNSVPVLVALRPSDEMTSSIKILRAEIINSSGENAYGNHDPHITLFVNTYKSVDDVVKRVRSVAETYRPINLKVQD